jgi:solute carrier family 12 (potassium/chloride transporters), member 9
LIFCVTIGAARIIQAVAKDNLIPGLGWLARGSGKNNEPRVAVFVTYILIQLTVFMGSNVNFLASFTTMFFLLSYGSVNLACFVVSIAGAPNFRPQFRWFHWVTAWFGAVLCLVGMFLVKPVLAVVSVFILLAIMVVIAWRAVPNDWGDVTQALMYHQVRKYLLRLDIRKEHVKYWRPQILFFTSNPTKNIQ